MRICDGFRREHAAFDEAMELLGCLPSDRIRAVPLDVLAEDFGYETQAPIRRLIDVLQQRGFEVALAMIGGVGGRGSRRGGGLGAYVRHRGYRAAQAAAQRYLDQIEQEDGPAQGAVGSPGDGPTSRRGAA